MASVYPIAFPYSTGALEKASLTRLVLRDMEDLSRINLTIKDKRCHNIEFVETAAGTDVGCNLRYITNTLQTLPLLLCVPATHSRMKLHIDVSQIDPESHSENELIIVKSPEPEEDEKKLESLLLLDDWCSTLREISKIEYKDIVPEDESNIVIVNDFIQKKFFSNTVSVSVWEKSPNSVHLLFKFDIWLESTHAETTSASASASPLPQLGQAGSNPRTKYFDIQDLRMAFNFDLQDGPEFRKVLSKYENDTPRLKRALIVLQDEIRSFEKNLGLLLLRRNKIIDAVGVILDSQFNSLLPQLHVHASFTAVFTRAFDAFRSNCSFILEEIFNPTIIQKMASYCNIPSADTAYESSSKKRNFEKQSKDYYDWLNKYLSNEKDRPQLKLLLKRKNFELLKFDYLNSLNLVSNNQYFNKFLENLIKFSNLQQENGLLNYELFMNNKHCQKLIDSKAQLYLDTLSRFNSEKLQLRQMIEACLSNEELTGLLKDNPISFPGKAKPAESGLPKIDTHDIDPNLVFPASPIVTTPGSTLSEVKNNSDQDPNISGILYALGGQGKPGWHKEWVVLRNGQLMEFSDWRNGTSPINRPIDVAIASVKPINHDKRQNCFEIITSTGHKHVFQALNNEERNLWLKALYNAGQITNRLLTKTNKARTNNSLITKPLPLEARKANNSPVSIFSSSFPYDDHDYLAAVRALKGRDNDKCADCGSYDSVEWISLNILVAVCVKCSSCHRNMGSHISKVKSVKLDNFKAEQKVLLNYIDNCHVNEYLEQTVYLKLTPDASDEERLTYIRNKYEYKAYVSSTDDLNALLVRLVRRIDIPGVIKSLNCGAEPNLNVQITNSSWPEPRAASLFEYSLKKVVELEDKGEKQDFFVVSELLILNNCRVLNLKNSSGYISLSEQAIEFWKEKAKLCGTED